jgi:release factor glutamine methyltransferase
MPERIDSLRARLREDALGRGINPRDVDLLLGTILGKTLPWLIAHGEEQVDPEPLEKLLARRYRGEPLQYIRGKADFYSREFLVDDRVLIPRPETELVVEAAIARAPQNGRVIDIGTGSGCIAISIERERPDLAVAAIDISPAALAVAAANARRLESGVMLAASDLLAAIRGPFDLIVSNPPYIPGRDIAALEVQVRDHEPRNALTPGPHGTEAIEGILDQAGPLLRGGGEVILEIGWDQEKSVPELAEAKGFAVETFIHDLAGIARVVVLSAHAE